ncbi:unnamed protein product [Acanthoscelides obtectus]|uniref:Transposase n=1 Tax=Acanthoscelides obtectus TaxID=200917 RepID=A0A9P0LSJ1_ACAOB|nr:unnamed protein product [Acanthoscelides obtectus]CAK1621990.1 hypothetical protein AOBTE_LOCUS1258 [Acanthoscelides obtectus]
MMFWYAKSVIIGDFLEKGKTITGQYYSELLYCFDKKLEETRPHLMRKKVLLHQDDAPAHSSGVVAAKLHELHYEVQMLQLSLLLGVLHSSVAFVTSQ